MKARHQVSRNAVTLIKRFEGYRANAAQLPDGRWTIGYGHTLTAREGATVSLQDAEALLLYDLIAVAHAVNEHTYTPLNQNQFDALTSFAFNIGAENFQRSAVLRRINEGALIQAACAMEMWRKADFGGERIVIDALVRRRSAEKTLFLTPPDGWIAAPSPILPPKVDYDASYAVPRQAPAPVVAPLDSERAEAHLDPMAAVAPVPPEDDETPTLSERAAAAVSVRLEAILPEVPSPEPAPAPQPPPQQLDAAPQSTEDIVAEVQPFPDTLPPEPSAPTLASSFDAPFIAQDQPVSTPVAPPPPPLVAPQPDPVPAPTSEPLSLGERPAPTEARPADVVSSFDPAYRPDVEEQPRQLLPLVLLAAVGLIFFAGGVFWGVSATPGSANLAAARLMAWALGLVGVTCFAAAAYLLLRRLDIGAED